MEELGAATWRIFMKFLHLSIFRKSMGESSSFIKTWQEDRVVHMKAFALNEDISLKSSYNEKCFRQKVVEKIKTNISCSLSPPTPLKSCCLWDNVEKYIRVGQATDNNMAHALCMLHNEGYKHTLRICNNFFPHGNNGYANAPQYSDTSANECPC